LGLLLATRVSSAIAVVLFVLAAIAPPAVASSGTLMPYGAGGYSYLVVQNGGLPGFEAPGFDESATGFTSGGQAPFSNSARCGYPQATYWPENTDLLTRKSVFVPADDSNLSVSIAIDNDADVYWNGTLIGSVTHDGCATEDSFTFQVPASSLQLGQDNLLAVRAIDRGAGTYFDATVRASSALGAPQDVQTVPHNGDVTVTWEPPTTGANLVTGYKLTATPVANDRVPPPSADTVSVEVPAPSGGAASTLTADIPGVDKNGNPLPGLVVDCHQLYKISVAAEHGTTVGPEGDALTRVRPSGVVEVGQDPPYVVILVDGFASMEPGFTENPQAPSFDDPSGYCPESFTLSGPGGYHEANFFHAHGGPWSFFHKWNFGEIDDQGKATGDNPDGSMVDGGNSESLPRERSGPDVGLFTSSYMLDAIAAQGAIILPYSYTGFDLPDANHFSYTGYGPCDSTSGITNGNPFFFIPGVECANVGPSIEADAVMLGREVYAVSQVWPSSKIVILSHSQGGLISYTYWVCAHSNLKKTLVDQYCSGRNAKQILFGDSRSPIRTGPLPANFAGAFSMDSPINGACGRLLPFRSGPCTGPETYPAFDDRESYDPAAIALERATPVSQQFHFIGTYGDSPGKAGVPGYNVGSMTLEHEMLFDYNAFRAGTIESRCSNALQEGSCPIPGAFDHISDCPVANDPDNDGDDSLNSDFDRAFVGDDEGGKVNNLTGLIEPWETAHFVEKYCPGNVNYFNSTLGLSY
jgi:hypothetical protein